MMNLYLIRHANAEERGLAYPDDSKRPLTAKGHKQAHSLASNLGTQDIQFDQLFSSPYTRAAQTTEPLIDILKQGQFIHYLDALANNDYPALIAEVKEWLEPTDTHVAFVGHEPFMSELASYLLTGQPNTLVFEFKKSAIMQLSGSLEANQMTLKTLIPYYWYKFSNPDR